MSSFEFANISVRTLFVWLDERKIAIPEIQREFVWNAKRACALLDSLYKNFPVGTAMIWKTRKEHAHMLRQKLHILPPYNPTNKDIYFLIDGQQRFSVLHQVREGTTWVNGSGRTIRFGDIFFDIETEEDRFVYLKRPEEGRHFPVSSILSPDWKRHFKNLPQYKLHEIQYCRSQLLDYRLFLIFLNTKDLADVRETFIRINTQGLRISEADKAFTTAANVKPLHRFHHLVAGLKNGFNQLDKNIYWSSLVLIKGYPGMGQKVLTRFTKGISETEQERLWFERHEPKVAESIGLACDYLSNSLAVREFRLLPYENMVVMLAVFFYWNNRAQPKRSQREQIKKWFWHTAVLKRYSGSGYHKNITADAEFFKRLGKTKKGRYKAEQRASIHVIVNEEYRSGSALSLAFQLLLTLQRPCYVTNGECFPLGPVSAFGNSKELHHIWARDFLKRHGIASSRYNSLCNICYLVADDNRSFGAQPPRKYFAEFRDKKHFPRAMRSHLIPHDDGSAVWDENVKRGFKQFLDARRALIANAFHKAAGSKLFER